MSVLTYFLYVSAQEYDVKCDTLQRKLKELTVTGSFSRVAKLFAEQGRAEWNMALMDDLPKILGNADPMHYLQTLPGVQTNNEYDSGLHIQGCDNSHNLVCIDAVPVYNASHMLGLFSVFNPTHYSRMILHKTASNATFPNRLGGLVSLCPHNNLLDSMSGDLQVGLISSQGTIRLPLGGNSALTVSARSSYLNWLYGYALKADESQLGYTFGDVNASWLYQPDADNRFRVDAYWGGDHARMQERDYQADIRLKWGNAMASIRWEHRFDDRQQMAHTIYYTTYHSRLQLDQLMGFTLPSSISDAGYRGKFQRSWLNAGIDAAWHHLCQLSPKTNERDRQFLTRRLPSSDTQELSAWADMKIPMSSTLSLSAGLRTTVFMYPHVRHYTSADPSISLCYNDGSWRWDITASNRHQYLFQSSFSAIGLPTESWSAADSTHRPQSCVNLYASVGKRVTEWGITFSAEVYYKRLRHQLEYQGTALDFLSFDESGNGLLYSERGSNYGINLTVMKTVGRLSGWVSYNIGRAMRHYDEEDAGEGWFPASHERIYELNVVAIYKVGRRWCLGTHYTMASGTPITMPEHLYLYGGYPVSSFSSHNAHRLKGYSRLDLSANYRLSSLRGKEHGINVSLYNALGRQNELFYSWHVSRTGSFAYRPVSFLIKVMPSISYYAKF